MSDFELKRENIEEIIDFEVLETEYESGAEQRRLKHDKTLIGFRIKTPALIKPQMQEYRDFFIGKYGTLDSFTFTSPFDDVEYKVKFEKGSFRTIFEQGYYRCEFAFKRVL